MTLQEILNRIQSEFARVMGPLAPVILKEKAAEFGMSMQNLPPEKMPELVEEASFEIRNHRKKVQFQRAALKILREVPQQPVVTPEPETLKTESGEIKPARRKTRLRLAEDPRTQREDDKVSAERKGGLRLAQAQHREGKT